MSKKGHVFNAEKFLALPGLVTTAIEFASGARIFAQGDPADAIMYLQRGSVKFSTVNTFGREAVVTVFRPGEFFGEDAIGGAERRLGTATAMSECHVLSVQKAHMSKLLHEQRAMSDIFIAHLLARNANLQEDLIDKLLNSSEKRLARALLMLARYGTPEGPQRILPKVSQAVLAEMIGTTRSRVNFFMNKFRKLGFIDYNGELRIHDSLLKVVLQDSSNESSNDH